MQKIPVTTWVRKLQDNIRSQLIRLAVKATECCTPTHTPKIFQLQGCIRTEQGCIVLVSHPTLGEVHKMSSVIMFLR